MPQAESKSRILFAILAYVGAPLFSHGQTTSLNVSVYQPQPFIDDADLISLHALTPVDVFANTAHQISSSLQVNGFSISWTITSLYTGGIGADVVLPMGHIKQLGALPAGSYHVVANWSHTTLFPGIPGGLGLIPGAPGSGSGALDFEVLATSHDYAGDYDDDGDVDGADFLNWQLNLGPGGGMTSDGNDDGVIDAADLAIWQNDFGSATGAAAALTQPVPEPATWVLLVGALLLGSRACAQRN